MRDHLRSLLFVCGLVVGCALLGGLYGPRIGNVVSAADRESAEQYTAELRRLVELIDSHYAEQPDWEEVLYEGAIPNMLAVLDPHSSFFSPEDFRRLREEQRGSYAGVGMQIRSFEGRTIVDFPFPGTPAFRAGMKPSDVIERIDGKSAEGMSLEEVANAVRGPAGSTVRLQLYRPSVEETFEAELTRADIPRPSVPLTFFLEPGVGYVKISNFGEPTIEEFDNALEQLFDDGLDGLVLDLRDNNGGLLAAGVHVAGRFLQKGELVVYHRGRASRERRYEVREGNGGRVYPVTVLVNCRSASASEIVAGALQDHDRGLIAGTPTFGKGLVQSVFEMPNSSALVLTTARYYTPSGRMIQRRYDNVTLHEYFGDPCRSGYHAENGDAHLTDRGRTVYGGGGITPDVSIESIRLNDFQAEMQARRSFERFAAEFVHESPPLQDGWSPDEEVIERFRKFLQGDGVKFTAEGFAEVRDYIYRRIQSSVYTYFWNIDEGTRVDVELDPAVRRSRELLPQARALLNGERLTAARRR